MDSYVIAIGSAVWLGILTSISPCPLATNIAAISFIGKRVNSPREVIFAGILYMLGRMTTYIVLGGLIVASVLSISNVSMFLQQNMNKLLGPILILVGIFLLDLIQIHIPAFGFGTNVQNRVERYGIWGAGLLGLLFALSFCPVSAALFFGSLISLAVEHQSAILMPTVYGIGTALPVIAFAVIIALSTRMVGIIFNRLTVFEKWARTVTGVIFIAVGIYYSLVYIFKVTVFN